MAWALCAVVAAAAWAVPAAQVPTLESAANSALTGSGLRVNALGEGALAMGLRVQRPGAEQRLRPTLDSFDSGDAALRSSNLGRSVFITSWTARGTCRHVRFCLAATISGSSWQWPADSRQARRVRKRDLQGNAMNPIQYSSIGPRGACLAHASAVAAKDATPGIRAAAADIAASGAPVLRAAGIGRSMKILFALTLLLGGASETAAQTGYVLPNAFVSGAAGRTGSATYTYPPIAGVTQTVTYTVAGSGTGTGTETGTGSAAPNSDYNARYRLRTPNSTFDASGSPTAVMFSPGVNPNAIRGPIMDTSRQGCLTTPTCATPPRGTLTITFLEAVTNPIIHFAGLGVDTPARISTIYTVAGASNNGAPEAVTLTRLAGNSVFAVNGLTIDNSVATNSINVSCAANQAACGSVMVNGTFNSITLTVTVEGGGFPTAGEREGHAVSVSYTPRADVRITKTNTFATDGPNDLANDTVVQGTTRTYTLVATNTGPNSAGNAILRDPAPTGLTCQTATCTAAANGAACPAAANLTIANLQSSGGVPIPTFPPNGSVTVELSCTVN
ncbi:hypothetical protein GLE_2181 [Lysobacter enzymogenes]|uniref:Uncharacterized protein n=1 Tax=Lysobacter enzymogenes TaxID=69 RepID=A0A0S2DG81_LYSEN|nr:DUF11 domain-containing protein [Lysobacter enzymogenes]ALN57530.1 hypothetical protein GLE_2181 [Lysobacter enzymogenes]QCW26121.1 DUF11 domain-containing protein [Lysobacter enzymogenes]